MDNLTHSFFQQTLAYDIELIATQLQQYKGADWTGKPNVTPYQVIMRIYQTGPQLYSPIPPIIMKQTGELSTLQPYISRNNEIDWGVVQQPHISSNNEIDWEAIQYPHISSNNEADWTGEPSSLTFPHFHRAWGTTLPQTP